MKARDKKRQSIGELTRAVVERWRLFWRSAGGAARRAPARVAVRSKQAIRRRRR